MEKKQQIIDYCRRFKLSGMATRPGSGSIGGRNSAN